MARVKSTKKGYTTKPGFKPMRENRRKTDNEELIEIPEEVQIPGTDVILEAGDKIRVRERQYDTSDMSLENLDVSVGTSIREMIPHLRTWVAKVLNRNFPAYMPIYEVEITPNDIYKVEELTTEGTFRVYDPDPEWNDLPVMEGDFRAYHDLPGVLDSISIVRLVDEN